MNAASGTPPDIDFNRRGELSPAQAAVVVSMDYATMMGSVGPPFAFLTLLGVATTLAYGVSPLLALGVFLVAAGPAAAGAVWAVRAVRRSATQRARAQRLRAAEGYVAWSGTGWAAFERTPAGPRAVEPVVLPPGPYRFYLYGDRVIGAESPLGPGAYSITQILEPSSLSLQLLPSGTTRMTPLPLGDAPMLLAALAQAGGFTQEDLDANRRGVASPAQARVAPEPAGVACVEGPVQLRWEMPTKLTVNHLLVTGDARVPVPAALGGAVVPGLSYRLYRSASTGRLLSLEPVSGL